MSTWASGGCEGGATQEQPMTGSVGIESPLLILSHGDGIALSLYKIALLPYIGLGCLNLTFDFAERGKDKPRIFYVAQRLYKPYMSMNFRESHPFRVACRFRERMFNYRRGQTEALVQ
jgi:hypothetical protein